MQRNGKTPKSPKEDLKYNCGLVLKSVKDSDLKVLKDLGGFRILT